MEGERRAAEQGPQRADERAGRAEQALEAAAQAERERSASTVLELQQERVRFGAVFPLLFGLLLLDFPGFWTDFR